MSSQVAAPGTSAQNQDTGSGNVAWSASTGTLVSAVASADTAYAKCDPDTSTFNGGGTSKFLDLTGFGFALVGTVTSIDGVQVTIRRKRVDNTGGARTIKDKTIQLIKGGAASGSNKADTGTNWPTALTAASYGSSSDLWSLALTQSDVEATNFGVRINVTGTSSALSDGATDEAQIDQVSITVYYTASGSALSLTLTESVTVGEADAETLGRALSEAATVGDADVETLAKALSEAASIGEADAETLARAFTETASVTDADVEALTKALSEVAAVGEVDAESLGKTLSETLGLTEVQARTVGKVLAETATVAELDAETLAKAITETLTTAETKASSLGKQLAESATVQDALARALARTLTESFGIGEAKAASVLRSLAEVAGVADISAETLAKGFFEVAAIQDAAAKALTKEIAEAFGVTEQEALVIRALIGLFRRTLGTRTGTRTLS